MKLTDADRNLFGSGAHVDLGQILGAHIVDEAVWFAVWAPNADRVTVIGDWNGWDKNSTELHPDGSGIWHATVVGPEVGHRYKYVVRNRHTGYEMEKADPVAFSAEEAPRTASVITDLAYEWSDASWMSTRGEQAGLDQPISIYEVHLGSWRYEPGGYQAIAAQLADYLDETHFTHVEFLPVMEHPLYASWGYQTLGYFAPTSRYGSPQDFKAMVDLLHQRGFGVILDWVPSHFPADDHGLATFDGTHLYEHADQRLGFHPDWKSCIFNYDRHEIRSFLLSSAMWWLDEYHADGIRVDAVASMLYRDYSRKEGEWLPNEFGGRENLGAVSLLKQMNESIYNRHPDVHMIAEESTSWPGVSRPTSSGGLGFGMKWDMGWMHDTLKFFERDPIHRQHHLDQLSFRMLYAFNENFALPLSHDEVVHGKGSMVDKMPGDRWQQLANLRLLYGYQWAMPGKKLLFMGSEFAVSDEWNHAEELHWDLLQHDEHRGVLKLISDLNVLLREEPSLHAADFSPDNFSWIVQDTSNSVIAFSRHVVGARPVLTVVNLTPMTHYDYQIGVSARGPWAELLSTDDLRFGGSGVTNPEPRKAEDDPQHGHPYSLRLSIPPLGAAFFAPTA